VYSVVSCLAIQHDYRIVALAALICAASVFTSFRVYSHLSLARGPRRVALLLLAGVCTGAGIWATHFVAMVAYDAGIQTAYEPVATAGSLLIAVAATTLGFAVSSGPGNRKHGLGGTVIGLGIAMMHYSGMSALLVPGRLEWSTAHVIASLVIGGIFAAAALIAYHRVEGRRSVWLAAGLMTLAICGLHFTAMGAVTIAPDPTIAIVPSQISNGAIVAAVTGAALLVLLSGITAVAVMENQTRRLREVELEGANALLRDRGVRLQAIVDNFPGGITVLEHDLRISIVNECAKRLLDLPERLFSGGAPRLEDVFRFNAERGEYGPGDVEAQVAARMALAREGKPHAFERERPDGTVIEVRGTPLPGGGFVTTYMDATERRRSQARIMHMAHHDALTDLPNRALLKERLEHALTSAGVRQESVAVFLLDLDRFKETNDTLGHSVGDDLLKAVACRLREGAREGATVARLGGDEFAIVDQVQSPDEATALAERVQSLLRSPFDLGHHQIMAEASIGIAIGPGDGKSPDELLRNADLALYRSKADGRCTYRFFKPGMDARMRARRTLETDLRRALANDEFEVHYQPFMDLRTDRISGCEALLRWRHPRRGLVSPAEFIPVAEENGLILPIGEWVLKRACADAATWPKKVKVAVNLSPSQFKSRDLVQSVFRVLAATRLPSHRLELEVTESALLQCKASTIAAVQELRTIGVQISMDDFGTGYSSLGYLQNFPFDKIKIDRSFVHNLGRGAGALAILKAITTLADSLGVSTIAEGVETNEQLDRVRAQGCAEAQGYLFGKPQPASEISKLLTAAAAEMESAA
jgi:diguanylate cyclase (GGDEF)-like protein